MNKADLIKILKPWLKKFLEKKFSNYEVEIEVLTTTINKIDNKKLKKLENYSFLEIKPDVLGILKHKKTGEIKLVFLNREDKSIGVREIGEMLCFCRLAKPIVAIMVSTKGLSSEVDKMINHQKKHKILSFDKQKIKIFRWDEMKSDIDKLTITPMEDRNFFD